jgi:hypothetical protein
MPTHKFTDLEIAIRIVPKRLRWPESGSSATWAKAHDCVDALQDLVRKVDVRCGEAEQDRELFASGLTRRRAGICDQAMITLANFKPFGIAEKALIENIDALERLSDRDPEQIQMHQKLKQGLRDLKEDVEATKTDGGGEVQGAGGRFSLVRQLPPRCRSRKATSTASQFSARRAF